MGLAKAMLDCVLTEVGMSESGALPTIDANAFVEWLPWRSLS